MLVIKKELSYYDFMEICEELAASHYVRECNHGWMGIVYDYLVEVTSDIGEVMDEMKLRDFLRFDIDVMSEKEVKNNYDVDGDVEDYINYHSSLIGSYEVHNTTYYVFYCF